MKAILITILIALLAGCKTEKEQSINTVAPLNRDLFQTTKAILTTNKRVINLNGTVAYKQDRVLQYKTLHNGIISSSNFSLGELIELGQPLLTIKSPELNEHYTEYIQAKEELNLAQRKKENARSLYEDQMLSKQELLSIESEYRQMHARVSQIEKLLAMQSTKAKEDSYTIHSEKAGFILEKNISNGDLVNSGDLLFTIVDLNEVWVVANIYPNNISQIEIGKEVELKVSAYPEQIFFGKIDQLSPQIDPVTKALKAYISIDNRDFKLKPEMYAEVKLIKEERTQEVAIPSKALVFDNNSYYVVIKESDTYRVSQVTPTHFYNELCFIKEGVKANDEIIHTNPLLIYTHLTDRD